MAAPELRALRAVDLGRIPYARAWDLQRRLVDWRRAAGPEADDLLLLCEHEAVVTTGRRAQGAERAGELTAVAAAGIEVVEVERGGAATFHGPGQLVGYPIVALEPGERDLHAFLRHLEGALIEVIEQVAGLPAGRREGLTGVWSQGRKVASIGIACRGWVTYHGFALNLTTDLTPFALFRPCDLEANLMASLATLGATPARDEVATAAHQALARRLQRRATRGPLPHGAAGESVERLP